MRLRSLRTSALTTMLYMLLVVGLLTAIMYAPSTLGAQDAPPQEQQEENNAENNDEDGARGQDDVGISCSGGGTVDAGTTHTVTCTIENDTGRNISATATGSGGVSVVSGTLSIGRPNFNNERTLTVDVTVNSKGSVRIRAQDHEDSDSDTVNFDVRDPDPDPEPEPTATPTPTPTPTPSSPDPGDPPAPPKPSNVRATGGDRSVTVTWNFRRGIEEYEVEYRKSGTTTWTSGGFVTGNYDEREEQQEEEGATGTEEDVEGEDAGDITTISSLDCGTEYQFRVSGLGDGERYADDWSPWSSTASASTNNCVVPPKPTSVSATAGEESASVSWSAESSGLTKFEVEYKQGSTTKTKAVSGGSSRSTTIADLTCAVSYSFRVRAHGDGKGYSSGWSSWSSSATATPTCPLPTVTVSAVDESVEPGTAAKFTFTADQTAPRDLILGLTFVESGDVIPGTLPSSKTISKGSTSTTLSLATHATNTGSVTVSIDSGTTYQVSLIDSATVTVEEEDPPPDTPVPSGLTARASYAVDTEAHIEWTQDSAIVDYQIGYRVEGSNDTYSTKTVDGPAATSEDPIGTGGPSGTAGSDDAEGQADNFTTISGLTADTAYEFRIRAMGDGETYKSAWGEWSSTVTATPGRPRVTVSANTTPITAGDSALFTFTIERTLPFATTISYSITETGDTVPGTPDTSVPLPRETATALISVSTHAENDGTVTATVTAGTHYRPGSTASATITVDPPEVILDPPPIPGNFTVVPHKTEDRSVNASWDENPHATRFQIEYRLKGSSDDYSVKNVAGPSAESEEGAVGSSDEEQVKGQTGDTAEITNLMIDEEYEFRIRAFGDGNTQKAVWSDWSSPLVYATPGRPRVSVEAASTSVTEGGTVHLTFTASYAVSATYQVALTTAGGDALSEAAPTSVPMLANETTAVLRLLTDSKGTFTVTVLDGGMGARYRPGSPKSATTEIELPFARAPGGLRNTSIGPSQVGWAWDLETNMTGYTVDYRKVGARFWRSEYSFANAHTVDMLSCETDYEFAVRGYGDGKTYRSAWGTRTTPSKKITTGTCIPSPPVEALPLPPNINYAPLVEDPGTQCQTFQPMEDYEGDWVMSADKQHRARAIIHKSPYQHDRNISCVEASFYVESKNGAALIEVSGASHAPQLQFDPGDLDPEELSETQYRELLRMYSPTEPGASNLVKAVEWECRNCLGGTVRTPKDNVETRYLKLPVLHALGTHGFTDPNGIWVPLHTASPGVVLLERSSGTCFQGTRNPDGTYSYFGAADCFATEQVMIKRELEEDVPAGWVGALLEAAYWLFGFLSFTLPW